MGAWPQGGEHRRSEVFPPPVSEQRRELAPGAGNLMPQLEGPWRAGQEGGTPQDKAPRGCGPGSQVLGVSKGSGLRLRPCSKSQAGSVPSEAQAGPVGRAAAPGKGLSSPLKMRCDLLQSLSFGFGDAAQSEKNAEDAEGGSEPEGAVGLEHLLRGEGKAAGARGRRAGAWAAADAQAQGSGAAGTAVAAQGVDMCLGDRPTVRK